MRFLEKVLRRSRWRRWWGMSTQSFSVNSFVEAVENMTGKDVADS
jgi:hypothetical protein